MCTRALVIVAVAQVLGWVGVARGATYTVGKGSKVTFLAKITGGSFEAASEGLSGTVDLDVSTGKLGSATVSVSAASFETGVSLRDRHMRDKYLEAKKHPSIRFEVGPIPVATTPGTTVPVKGTFIIKGKKKEMTVQAKVEAGPPQIVVSAKFPLTITDFGIEKPGFAVVEMDPTIEVTLKLVLTA